MRPVRTIVWLVVCLPHEEMQEKKIECIDHPFFLIYILIEELRIVKGLINHEWFRGRLLLDSKDCLHLMSVYFNLIKSILEKAF